MNQKVLASILYLGLSFRYFEGQAIIYWADSKISTEEEGYEDFVELSLTSSKNIKKILKELNSLFKEELFNNEVKKFYFGYFYDMLKKNKNEWFFIEKKFYSFVENTEFQFDDHQIEFFSQINNDIFLRTYKHGYTLNMPDDLISFFDRSNWKYYQNIINNVFSDQGLPEPRFLP